MQLTVKDESSKTVREPKKLTELEIKQNNEKLLMKKEFQKISNFYSKEQLNQAVYLMPSYKSRKHMLDLILNRRQELVDTHDKFKLTKYSSLIKGYLRRFRQRQLQKKQKQSVLNKNQLVDKIEEVEQTTRVQISYSLPHQDSKNDINQSKKNALEEIMLTLQSNLKSRKLSEMDQFINQQIKRKKALVSLPTSNEIQKQVYSQQDEPYKIQTEQQRDNQQQSINIQTTRKTSFNQRYSTHKKTTSQDSDLQLSFQQLFSFRDQLFQNQRQSIQEASDLRMKKVLPPIKILIKDIDLQRAKGVLEDDLISFMRNQPNSDILKNYRMNFTKSTRALEERVATRLYHQKEHKNETIEKKNISMTKMKRKNSTIVSPKQIDFDISFVSYSEIKLNDLFEQTRKLQERKGLIQKAEEDKNLKSVESQKIKNLRNRTNFKLSRIASEISRLCMKKVSIDGYRKKNEQ